MLLCSSEFTPASFAYVRSAQPDAPASLSFAIPASDMRQQLLAEMNEETMDCSEEDWDGYGAKTISQDAYQMARRFVSALPAHFPRPRVVADPDGWFAFEWTRGRRKSVVVSVDPDYRLHFSALLGQSEHEGSERFFDRLPESVEGLLQRLYRM